MPQLTVPLYSEHEIQRDKILELFRVQGGYCYTSQLVGLGIYQYNARIKELRETGLTIVSKKRNGCFSFELL